jgi:hypothetical protein
MVVFTTQRALHGRAEPDVLAGMALPSEGVRFDVPVALRTKVAHNVAAEGRALRASVPSNAAFLALRRLAS